MSTLAAMALAELLLAFRLLVVALTVCSLALAHQERKLTQPVSDPGLDINITSVVSAAAAAAESAAQTSRGRAARLATQRRSA
jgi:hypothetical protein